MGALPPNLPAPVFVPDADGLDPNKIVADIINLFQTVSGKTLQPAQVERLLINLIAYREALLRNAIQFAGEQNLLAYAAFPMLDYLGQLVGVARLPAVGAVTTIEFTIYQQPSTFLIPAGTVVQSADGLFQFATSEDLTIPVGAINGSVTAVCLATGPQGNGYVAGQINVLITPSSVIRGVANTDTSSGGATEETDDHFRARIQAAPNRFSVAGPTGAYRFFALGADAGIIDVQVVSTTPGTVTVYLLTGPIDQPHTSPNSEGIAGSALLSKVAGVLSADTVRPLTDTVNVQPVTEVDYAITATVTLYANADPTSTQAAVNAAAAAFAVALASRIQRDIVPEEIVASLGSVAGVYRVQVTSPVYTALTAGQWANCTAINLTFATASESS